MDDQGRAQVYIHVPDAEIYILEELQNIGLLVERWSESGTEILAWVPVKALAALPRRGG